MNPEQLGPWEARLRQLERMRSMQYAYHKHFFEGMVLQALLLLLLALAGGASGRALLPWVTVTAATWASFYLHFCDFARAHAAALEQSLNQHWGRTVLVGSEIEDRYFYPLHASKLAGFVPSAPGRFFSFFTLHWALLWTAAWGFGGWSGWISLPQPWKGVYAAATLLWTLLHAAYLSWFFLGRRHLRGVVSHLHNRLQPTP